MIGKIIRRCAVVLAAWLPLYVVWVLSAVSFGRDRVSAVLLPSLITIGSAGLLGIAVWHLCRRRPWPAHFNLPFYLLQIVLALTYAFVWTTVVFAFESLQRGRVAPGFWSFATFGRQASIGSWLYGLFAGVSYAVQTRDHLREKETLAARAEALATEARLDAVRARLNPHFLFNALHTLDALVKFRPAMAEGAIERLGDMLRYTLKEDGRELVEFSEEYAFTRRYLEFEQLRYEDRLKVDVKVDPECFNFDILPFSMQTLAENAVRHAISVRPEGGSLWIECACHDETMKVTVRDDGPGSGGDGGASHQLGLRSLRERLRAAYGASGHLQINSSSHGFEASFVVPRSSISGLAERKQAGQQR